METITDLSGSRIEHMSDESCQMKRPYFTTLAGLLYVWGPGNCTGDVLIYVGQATIADLKQGFTDVQQVGVTTCQYCMPYENDLPIFLCRGIKVPIEQAWPQTKVIQ